MKPKWNVLAINTINMFDGKRGIHTRTPIPAVKYGGGSLMFWRCFAASVPGAPFKINGIINSTKYQEILAENLVVSRKLASPGRR